jgi:hypothetical protein
MLLDRVGRPFFPEVNAGRLNGWRAANQKASVGMQRIGRFGVLVEATVEQGYAEANDYGSVCEISYAADLQLPPFRFWKTAVWNGEAVARALKIPWYYERIESLWQRGEVLLTSYRDRFLDWFQFIIICPTVCCSSDGYFNRGPSMLCCNQAPSKGSPGRLWLHSVRRPDWSIVWSIYH